MRKIQLAIYLLVICHSALFAQVSGDIDLRADDFSYSKQEGYDVIRMKGCNAVTNRVGAPELPAVVKTFVVPLNVSVSGVDVVVNNRVELKGKVVPCPVKAPVPVDGKEHSDETVLDSAVYNGAEVYPETHSEITADYNEMGYHLVTVRFNPVEWDPVSQKLYLKQLSFTLNYAESTDSYQSPQSQSRYRSDMIKNVIKTMVDNPQDVEECADKMVKIGCIHSGSTYGRQSVSANNEMIIDVLAEQIPDYVIITNRLLHDEFQRLADWKIQKGIPTIIKDVEDINDEYLGSDLAEKIHSYLQECKNKWGEGLFVLLGGDTNIVPARFYMAANSRDEKKAICPSDAYYSDLMCAWNSNNNHLYAERGKDSVLLHSSCYVGRASVENIGEATIFVNKVLAYEKMNNPSVDKRYLMNRLAVSAYIRKNENSGFLDLDCKKNIDNFLRLYSHQNGHDWYLFDHYNCTCNKHSDKYQYSNGQELNKANFIAALNDGGASGLNHFHIVYHMDHCSPLTIGTSCKDKRENMFIPEIDNLNNRDYQQIIISGGCETTHFDKDCVAEHFINNPHGGAVAFIGNANVGWYYEYNQYARFLKDVYNGDNNLSLGIVFQKMPKEFKYPVEDYKRTPDKMRLHLLGDPEMPIWSAVPQNIDAEINLSASDFGQTGMAVKIKNLPESKSAKVCLYKENEVYKRIEICDTLQHNIAINVKSNGTVKATVTARNLIPYEKEIQVSGIEVGEGPLKIEKITGFDGAINIGDSATVGICLRNMGSIPITNVSASLTTNSPYVRITGGNNVGYGSIPVQSMKSRDFKIVVSEDAVETGRNEWNGVCMYLTTTDDTNTVSVDTFKIDITSPRLRIDRIKIASTGDGDLIPEAGEYVVLDFKVARMGKKGTATPKLLIASLTDDIEMINIRSLSSRLKIANDYVTGSPLRLKAVLMSGNIPQDSTVVDVAETLPKIALTNIHGNSLSESVTLYWDKAGTETKYNVYRSSTENGTYEKLNKMPLDTRYIEDIGLPVRTAFYYRIATVAESCLEGPWSEPFTQMTTVPIMLYKEPVTWDGVTYNYECEANAVDLDYDGQKEIVLTSHDVNMESSVVVVVKPDGSEPYCIDGNATIFSGFSTYDWLVSAPPSVADLYGNGESNIVALSRKIGNTEDNATCYSVLDKDGDNLPDKLWTSPLIGEVYRGAVFTDINMPDGKGEKEIVVAMESKGIVVLNADGTKKAVFGNNITNNYSGLAVADLDGDGYKEIIYGQDENLYVWKHDGTPYLRSPFFSRSGMNLKSSPVICDIDNDGNKEIIVASRNNPSYIYAIKSDGTCVGNFDNMSSNPACIPYPSKTHPGLDHAVSVGDINSDGNLEVVALGCGCVRAWTNTGEQIFNREISGLFVDGADAIHLTIPLLADIDGDSNIDIVFNVGKRICAIHNDGTDVDGYQLTGNATFGNNILISDIDDDGKNEIVAADEYGFITVWKTEGNKIEWGRARYDAEFTGEYVPGYKEPMVIKSDIEWQGGSYPNDVIVRSGSLRVVSGKTLDMKTSYRLIVMDGATLEVDGGTITNANIFVKSGGHLAVKNNGQIKLSRYASLGSEQGAIIYVEYGCVE